MRRYLSILIPLFLFTQELKIASYNVENLFDDVNNGTEYKEYKLYRHNWNSNIFKKKINNLTKVICELNADVIGLQEVENKRALNILQKSLSRHGCNYSYSVISNKRGSAIQVALLSKVRVKKSSYIRVTNSSSDRDILEVTLDLKPKLTIFVNHWRSKRAKESARIKYAKALINRLKKLKKGSEYIILGDFNSKYNECLTISRRNNDSNGICGIDTVLKTFKDGKLLNINDKVTTASLYHYNLWSELPIERRWSHSYYGHKGALDSIIIPVTLNDNSGWFYKNSSFSLFKKSYLYKSSRGFLNNWEYKNHKHTGYGYSDHLPIFAIFSNNKNRDLKHEKFIDKFWKYFIPKVERKAPSINKKEIKLSELTTITKLDKPITIKKACVVFKRGDIGVVKESTQSVPIMLYKSADGLIEGSCYRLKVYKKKRYNGIEEILDLDILEKLGKIDLKNYISSFNKDNISKYNLGEIVSDIRGIYRDKQIVIDRFKVRIYLKYKNRIGILEGTHLYINKAQIGYYKGEKELIIYSSNDIIKEN